MRVEVTCLGCGENAAEPSSKTLPLCGKCAKAALPRGVGRKARPSEDAAEPKKAEGEAGNQTP